MHAKYITVRPAPAHARDQINQRIQHIRKLCQQVSLFLSPSRFLREQFVTFGVPPEKIIFLECGLPPLVSHTDDVHQTVMPPLRQASGQAPIGIQGNQSRTSGSSAWIPSFAGKTKSELKQQPLGFGYIGVVDPVKGIRLM